MNSKESLIGKIVEGYRIIKQLGAGQYSDVYHAERKSDQLHCAIKVIKVSVL